MVFTCADKLRERSCKTIWNEGCQCFSFALLAILTSKIQPAPAGITFSIWSALTGVGSVSQLIRLPYLYASVIISFQVVWRTGCLFCKLACTAFMSFRLLVVNHSAPWASKLFDQLSNCPAQFLIMTTSLCIYRVAVNKKFTFHICRTIVVQNEV